MMDLLLILGQIPGTNIRLNFYQLCLIMAVSFWLVYRRHYQLFPKTISSLSKKYNLTNRLKSAVIFFYMALQKPRQRLVRH